MNAARSPMRIQFAREGRRVEVEDHPRLVLLGAVPESAPWLGEALPTALVRGGRHLSQSCAFEHLRLRSSVDALPGLSSPQPSLLREACASALQVGVPELDVVLWRGRGEAVGRLTAPAILEQLPSFLSDLRGAVLVAPDLPAAGPRAVFSLVAALAQHLAESCQLLCLDLPEAEGLRLTRALTGADLAFCRWVGDEDALVGHRWRSAAAVVGGMLITDRGQGRSLTQRPARLRPPRRSSPDRRAELSPQRRAEAAVQLDELPTVDLKVDPVDNSARVLREETLRRPLGAWPLPALALVKQVHRRVAEAADHFVFRPVTQQEAVNLMSGLHLALRPFQERGLLVGAGGVGAPQIEGVVIRDPGTPGLGATITGYLRPWMQRIDMRVMVRSGEKPALVEA